jgi:DNA polymerase-4
VEPLSLDEAFLDVSGSEPLFGSAATIGRTIKQRIRDQLRLVASVGVAPNKFAAKIASDLEKPNGFVVVEPQQLQTFLDPLPVGRIWGVGKVTGQAFDRLGLHTIAQLRQMPIQSLRSAFGAAGEQYWKLANGIDDRLVVPDREAKSISHETTFPKDIRDLNVLRSCLVELVEQVGRRLRRYALRGRMVELKVRFADFQTITRSKTLEQPTDITQEMLAAAIELLTKRVPGSHLPVRLLGFGVHDLVGAGIEQNQLFGESDRYKQRQLDRVSDLISQKFGKQAIRRAAGLEPPKS